KNKYNLKVRPDVFIRSNPDRAAREIHKIIEGQFDAGLTLAKEYDVDFLQLTIFHINVLQHFFWNDDKTKKGWEIIDEKVGEILDTADNVLFMSDHGCNKIEHVFNINTWLEREGYLKTKRSFGDILKALHIDRELLAKISDRLHLQKFLRKLLPPSLIEGIPTDSGEVKKEGKTSKVDWENSQVFASGQGPIYFNKNNIEDTEKLKKEIINKLENLRHLETNKKMVDKVFRKEEIYEGEYLDEAPDLVMDQARGIHIAGGLGKEGVFQFSEKWKAENKKYGIFAAVGEDVERSGEIKGVSILDLAPTIIDYFGIKIPEDIDGKTLDIFSTKLTPDKKKMGSEETKKIEDALKDISI
ncbi:MAG: alkaline phosphatase family protein, partial [Candidatus Saliniplasma sp.]